ncbi:DNA-binding GntR family transcriptional regulator [Tamaricihabitans halophyticus]|uniref:DNA-binding GntR family transcriptional regulator n=1 Tax=Tamaricihabitans halophyticus TaxID=1262583 RepID=A0A4R2QDV3_9PSEU|nr:GntR family transcriptional regulator [Tamaricihabitans halophyticus]TCP47242.1 DNA-binding GntR family transcriptional regulator [Tamaricihabitans halophyticus]
MNARKDGSASRAAAALRAQIMDGELVSGTRLSEEQVREALGVSRSTLREAFQLLIRERLLVHELSRGVFVRELSKSDISDLYRVRRLIECTALRNVHSIRPEQLQRLHEAVRDGKIAAAEQRWGLVAAASVRFHEALVGLLGSERLDSLISEILAEFRLAYALMDDTETFHSAFLKRNAELADRIGAGDLDGAAELLESYLADSEAALLPRYEPRGRRS